MSDLHRTQQRRLNPASSPVSARASWVAAVLMSLLSATAWGQYKVVGPDGRVSYTDRPPVDTKAKVAPVKAGSALPGPALPLALSAPTAQFPVRLYVGDASCDVCAEARSSLIKRGIPYTEYTVTTREDVDALAQLTGGRELPVVFIGQQKLKGYAADTWTSYLDAAGYPKSSMLPPNYTRAPATPLVARATPVAEPGAQATPETAKRPDAPVAASSAQNPAGIRF